ncbi:PREDICTED: F-box/FBD/LRR-repeat protein At1g51370-like [Camelina sativa]|uniref:F-box/FBD/LRR-repeat protein At1g51370-like n=1 Tax=Camelina sativa TaxID=90675 RepID=A0ABM0UT79_CAMSA|nr:PREDICTED: F-box/FBD/LRR-repeat protein At1g51370-like [Camelina sativa]
MVGRKKRTQNCDKVSHEELDRISQLPECLISEILYHLSTKDAVRTSVLSTKWRYLWQWVPGLDVEFNTFSNIDAFMSFAERFFYSNRGSWIRKLRLNISDPLGKCDLNSWIDVFTTRRIQHLAVDYIPTSEIPLSMYTCKTLVHLQLVRATLGDAEFVSFPCLKIMHLEDVIFPNETMLEKLISGSPVLEDLLISRPYPQYDKAKVLQVRSHTLKRIDIDGSTEVVIDAPLLLCLRTMIYLTKNFEIISLGFPTKLDIDVVFSNKKTYGKSLIDDILTDITRVRDLVINNVILKNILLYSNLGQVLQFRDLSRLNAGFAKSDLEMLPTILESCPRLESFTLELVKDPSMCGKMKKEPNVMFSEVPRCLVSSLKFVELKRSIPRYEGEMELIRYLLKNSRILEKLRLNVYYRKKEKCDFLTELVSMTRCSSACKVLVL